MADSAHLEELVALDAAGALEPDDRCELRVLLNTADDHARERAASIYRSAATMTRALPSQTPPPSVKSKLMARIAGQSAQSAAPHDHASPPLPDRMTVIRADEGWGPHPEHPELRIKLLAHNTDTGFVTVLVKAPPRFTYPAHHHSGDEECYVIEGFVRAAGRWLGPGDFHHASGATDHEPLYTEHGVTVLLVAPAADYLPGA